MLGSPIIPKILLEKTVSKEEAGNVIFDVDSAECEARSSLNKSAFATKNRMSAM
jgi:hypothetical protein